MLHINKGPLVALGLLISAQVYAGGPLILEGTSGNTPVRYSPATVTLQFDIGMLGGSRTNAEADALVLEAFALWNNVSTSSLVLTQGNNLATDVNGSNYTSFVPDTSNHPANNDGLNPVIYDSDGSIIEDMFGIGASGDIAGFAASVYQLNGDKFKEGYAVLNGRMPLTDNDIIGLVTHEIGHFVGLDHSQLNIDNSEAGASLCSTEFQDKYPVMYPYLCRLEKTLHFDDIAAVSALYPTTNILSSFGQVNGVFVNTNNKPILGANLWLTNVSTFATYSIVSDYLLQGTGFFSLYLPAGDYTLHANSVNSIFYDVSSVGPYALNANDVSFQAPHPITAVDFGQSVSITVGAGTQVRFVIDGSGETSAGSIIQPPTSPAFSGNGGMFSAQTLLVLFSSLVYLRRRQMH